MPVFDTPITANDASLDRVLAQPLPIVMTLFSQRDQSLQQVMENLASEHAGKALMIRVNVDENPRTFERFGKPRIPAAITLKEGREAARTEAASPGDLEAHVRFALGQGPEPAAKQPPVKQQSTPAGGTGVPVHISEASFEKEVLQSNIPVLVDFWAPWCGPCHMIAPTLDRLAQTYTGRVKIAKLNVDDHPGISGRYQISGIPHLILFKNGQVAGRLVGAHPQQNIENLIAQHL
jgi:thioredoxin 1